MGIKELAKQTLSQKENIRYRMLLARKKVSYSQWLERQQLLWQEENDRILLNASDGGERIPGEPDDSDYVFICAARGVMTAYARNSMICFFLEHPQAQILYGDEDVRGADKKACSPVFRPGWSPDVLNGCFYFGSLVAMRKQFFLEAAGTEDTRFLLQAVKTNDYVVTDFREYVRWMHRCVELAGGYRKNSRGIGHVAQILFHCESPEELEKYRISCFREHSEALLADFRRRMEETGQGGESPLVSVVIPSRDHPRLLEKCLQSVKDVSEGIRLEAIVVDNGSTAENRVAAEKLTGEMSGENMGITYLYQPMGFNFSRMCNLGAKAAKGDFLLFLNDDVELAVQGCVEQMAALAARPYTGAVGMKLYYPGSKKIQHAGITNLPMGPVHKLQFQEDGAACEYVCGGNVNYLAVTAACLMIERAKFRETGGFTERLQVAFNDVELCFRLYEAGYSNVCMNGCHAWHHESLSRGSDESAEKLERLLKERNKLYDMHPGLEGKDPYYSVSLGREGLDTKIRPAYETAANVVQEYDKFLAEKTLQNYRRDQCVMVRIEAVQSDEIYGWTVVLGDNNACYDKKLMLKKIPDVVFYETNEWFRSPEGVLVIPLAEQYRPDLEENMPDQQNVALSGFHVRLKANLLLPGRYRIGAAVRHRITGAGLVNWSERYIEIT